MFKKSLIAIAALGAFAGSAMAADITISGRIDTGLNFHDYEYKHDGVVDEDGNSFGMMGGQYSGSRVTIKGSEELGNGMKAGFILENGFESDDGSFSQADKLFGREAIVYLEGGFGHISMGREGALSSGLGSYNVVYGYSPFSTGWGDYTSNNGLFMLGDRSRWNNTITYRSPEFAGVQVYAQYSFEADAQEADQSTKNKRYAALGATYKLGAFSTGLVVDTIMNESDGAAEHAADPDSSAYKNTEDSLGISWGASYDLGVTKPMILVQYGKNENKLGGFSAEDVTDVVGGSDLTTDEGLKGYAVSLGAVTPLFGGNLYTSVNYTDGETDGTVVSAAGVGADPYNTTADIERWGFAVGYDYPLSKRTKLYGFASYSEGELKATGVNSGNKTKYEEQDIEAGVGLIHYF